MNYYIQVRTFEEDNLLFNENTTGVLEEDVLTFSNDVDTIRIHLNNFLLVKENNESIFRLTKERCELKLKEINQSMDIPLLYVDYQNLDNKKIKVEYRLVSQDKPFKIEIEIGDVVVDE